ncbi:MAG: InlB B-repeat-containing protein [Bacilli bacterium]|nr:InlB B-repeat-containing protein [Bacilli bacterium]
MSGYFYYYDDQGAVQKKTVSSNLVTISFNVHGGVAVGPIHPAFEEPIALPTPTRDVYEFDAWYASEDASVQLYVPTGVPAINSMKLKKQRLL